jgi:hypothetical protein
MAKGTRVTLFAGTRFVSWRQPWPFDPKDPYVAEELMGPALMCLSDALGRAIKLDGCRVETDECDMPDEDAARYEANRSAFVPGKYEYACLNKDTGRVIP